MRSLLRRAALLSLALAVIACDCDGGIQKVDPALAIDTESLDFGLVGVGDALSQTVRLSALTSADVEISVTFEEADGPFSLDTAAPTFVPGRGEVELSIVLAPVSVDVFVGTLRIESNDPRQRVHRVALSGEGKSPEMRVAPESLSLSAVACPPGAQSARCSDTQSVTVENVGLVDLLLRNVELRGEGGAAAPANLTLDAPPNARLVPGDRRAIAVRWKPSDSQTPGGQPRSYAAALVLETNDPLNERVEIPVVARAEPNAAPSACIEVLQVMRREYELDSNGRPKSVEREVPASEYVDPSRPGELQVKPNMTVTLTSQPCTLDPEGETLGKGLTYSWTLLDKPDESRASLSPAGGAQTTFEIDAAGSYAVTFVVTDSLGLTGAQTMRLNAVPDDDLFVQLSWDGWDSENATAVDLDLHLVVDAGPGVPGPGALFCEQDVFFYNPSPAWFEPWAMLPNKLENDPRFLRDDQGGKGRLESTTLAVAPGGSRYRVLVHYYDTVLDPPPAVLPKLKVRVRGQDEVIELEASAPLTAPNEVWGGALIEFPAAGAEKPTVTALQERSTAEFSQITRPLPPCSVL